MALWYNLGLDLVIPLTLLFLLRITMPTVCYNKVGRRRPKRVKGNMRG